MSQLLPWQRLAARRLWRKSQGGAQRPAEAPTPSGTYVERHGTRSPLTVSPPTFTGPERHSANGVAADTPKGSQLRPSLTGTRGVAYAILPDNSVHMLRRRADGTAEEVQIPRELIAQIRAKLGLT